MQNSYFKPLFFLILSFGFVLNGVVYSQNDNVIPPDSLSEKVNSLGPDGEPPWEDVIEKDNAPSQDQQLNPNSFRLLEQDPEPINMDEVMTLIGYPQLAKDKNMSGRVILRILVDEKGNYVEHKRILNLGAILTHVVEEQVHLLKFSPGIFEGRPVSAWVTIPFEFKITENDPPEKRAEKEEDDTN